MRNERHGASGRITVLSERIAELGPWFHNLRIGRIDTAPDHPLGEYPAKKWQRFRHVVPEDLSGRTVLDIVCNAGFCSIEMPRRNAARVVAIDNDPRYLAQAELAANDAGVSIDLREMSVYDIARLGEWFDFVIFIGVFYHLRYPLLALDLVHKHVVGDLMLFQSMQRGSSEVSQVAKDHHFDDTTPFECADWSRLHFIEHRYAGDPTNWFIPIGRRWRQCCEARGSTSRRIPKQRSIFAANLRERDHWPLPSEAFLKPGSVCFIRL